MAKEKNDKKTPKTTKEPKKEEKVKEPIRINKFIVVLIILLIIAIIFKIVVKPTTKDNPKKDNIEEEETIVNDNKNVLKEQQVDGLTFSDVTLVTQNNQTFLTVKVTNNSGSDYKLEEVHIFLKDKNKKDLIEYVDEEGNIINYLVGYVGDTLKTNENRDLVANIDTDVTNKVNAINYKIIK